MNILRIVDGKVYTFTLTKDEMRFAFDEQRLMWDKLLITQLVNDEAMDYPDDEKAQEMKDALTRNEELLSLVATYYRSLLNDTEEELTALHTAYGHVVKMIEEVD